MPNKARLLPALILLCVGSIKAEKSTSVALSVSIKPAISMTAQGPKAIGIMIRLSAQAQARLWQDDNCSAFPVDAYTISKSGSYTIALDELKGGGNKVCLVSSDGSLSATLSLPSTNL